MKKLMMALAVVACMGAVQAASFSWTASGLASTKNIYAKDGTTLLYSANSSAVLYLFDAGVVSQDTLLTGLRGGKTIADFTSVASQTIASNSRITTQGVTYGTAGNEYNFYMAIVNGDDVFMSASSASSAQASDTSLITINGMTTATKKAFSDSTATFGASGAGWYSTASSGGGEPVPEPTSGLLMLLGVAGLALRRRRI